MKTKQSNPLASRIKRVMQADDDVGKIAQATPVLIGRSVEVFLSQICKGAGEIATTRGDKTLNTSHLKAFVSQEASLDFLRSLVQNAPDLADKPTSPAQKKQRAASVKGEDSTTSSRGRGRGRSAGRGRRESGEPSPRKRPRKAEADEVAKPAMAGRKDAAKPVAGEEPTIAQQLPSGAEAKVAFEGSGPTAAAIISTPMDTSQRPEGGETRQQEAAEEPAVSDAHIARETTRQSEAIEEAASAPSLPQRTSAAHAGGGLEDEDDYDAEE